MSSAAGSKSIFCEKPLRTHEVLQELRDISSMAIDHFEEKIAPTLKKAYCELPSRSILSTSSIQFQCKSKCRRHAHKSPIPMLHFNYRLVIPLKKIRPMPVWTHPVYRCQHFSIICNKVIPHQRRHRSAVSRSIDLIRTRAITFVWIANTREQCARYASRTSPIVCSEFFLICFIFVSFCSWTVSSPFKIDNHKNYEIVTFKSMNWMLKWSIYGVASKRRPVRRNRWNKWHRSLAIQTYCPAVTSNRERPKSYWNVSPKRPWKVFWPKNQNSENLDQFTKKFVFHRIQCTHRMQAMNNILYIIIKTIHSYQQQLSKNLYWNWKYRIDKDAIRPELD